MLAEKQTLRLLPLVSYSTDGSHICHLENDHMVCLASKGSLLTITSFGCQQYTGNSAHLATLYCLPRATRDNLESQGRAVLPMCLLKHKRAGEEHTLR